MRAACLVVLASLASAGEYRISQENFPNPERGFYVQAIYDPQRKETRPVDPAWLRQARGKGISLLRRYWVIREFRDAPLSPEMLALVAADFRAAREAGFKVIGRFAYNFGPQGTPDAPLDRVLQHIDQLGPVLRDNADVLAFLEAGFAGTWGEWHHSTNGLLDHAAKIIDRLLNVLPADRMVALRYPHDRLKLFGDQPLTLKDAWSGAAKARIGAHNDCFLASNTDRGTWTANIVQEKAFYHEGNLFVPQGGETCELHADSEPVIACANALKELEFQRFTTLNSMFNREVLDRWQQDGCMAEIERRLGYRLRLVESAVTVNGNTVQVTARVRNDGYADLYNPRPLYLVLRNRSDGTTTLTRVHQDPRRWFPGEDTEISMQSSAPPGEYDVLLYLPDASERLQARPEYAVRFANQDVWEPATGMNRLSEVAKVQ